MKAFCTGHACAVLKYWRPLCIHGCTLLQYRVEALKALMYWPSLKGCTRTVLSHRVLLRLDYWSLTIVEHRRALKAVICSPSLKGHFTIYKKVYYTAAQTKNIADPYVLTLFEETCMYRTVVCMRSPCLKRCALVLSTVETLLPTIESTTQQYTEKHRRPLCTHLLWRDMRTLYCGLKYSWDMTTYKRTFYTAVHRKHWRSSCTHLLWRNMHILYCKKSAESAAQPHAATMA